MSTSSHDAHSSSSSATVSTSRGSKKRQYLYCGHCEKHVSKTVFYLHRRLYFDQKCMSWSKKRLFLVNDDPETPESMPIDDDEENYITAQDENDEMLEEGIIMTYSIVMLSLLFLINNRPDAYSTDIK